MLSRSIILFDGACNLCNGFVQFVIKRDAKNYFRFTSLQSSEGEKLLERHKLSLSNFKSFILIENGKPYLKSGGALKVLKKLDGLWPLLYGFIIIPKFMRNRIYEWIAKNRYRWFGKKEECIIPTPELGQDFSTHFMMANKKTLVLGASSNPARYSYLALRKLAANNHTVAAIGKRIAKVDNIEIDTEQKPMENIDTITLYLNANNQKQYYDYILSLHPRRIIFNPGAENEELSAMASKNGIKTMEACTLVLLSTGQY